jgi:hypothetical protein
MITEYLYKKLNCTCYGIIIITIIFSIMLGGVLTLIIPQEYHWVGMLICVVAGFVIGLIMTTEDINDSIFLMISIPLLSTVIYEISTGIQYSVWIFIIIIAVMTEILFLLDKTSPSTTDKDNVMWFTAGRKIEALIEALVIFMLVKGIGRELNILDYSKIYSIFVEDLKYLILVAGVIAIIYIFVWINSWRYRK